MSTAALAFVVAAAFAHAGWNLLAKTASGGAVFVWLCTVTAVVLWLPALAVAEVADPSPLGLVALGLMAGSGALHAVYFVLLQRGYRDGDLSLVYPLARGTGPVLATLAAIVVLSERPSAIALAGAAVIVGAVLSLASRPGQGAGPAVAFALFTGVAIAGYTLWDKQAVGEEGLQPVTYYWGTLLANAAILTPWVLGARAATVAPVWREHRRQVLGVALLSPLAYVLVLFALARAPVSYVAPARELSILIAAAAGATLLDEGDTRRRLLAAAAIVVGVGALAIG